MASQEPTKSERAHNFMALMNRLRIIDDEAAEQALLDELSRPTRPFILSFLNAHAVNLGWNQPGMLEGLLRSDMVLRDGIGVKLGLKAFQRPFGLNMNGTDFIPKVARAFKGRKVALFGTRSPWLDNARRTLEEWGLNVVASQEGFDPPETYLRLAAETKPDLILMAMGMPKQEEVSVKVEVLTLFAFSSENWRRPRDEINGLMALFVEALRREVAELDANGIRLRFIGQLQMLGSELNKAIEAAELRTRDNSRMELTLAVAYGGRWDMVEAARQLARDVQSGKLSIEQIDEASFSGALASTALPAVDLLIRSGGEQRLSNFLLWELAYSELYFSEALWPDFNAAELDAAFDFYASRQRRFGRTGDQVEVESC
jgi:undecaprenyl diphosphate synthase